MKYNIHLTYKGGSWSARLIKKALLSTGYNVFLLERKTDKPVIGFTPFVVCVKSPLDSTCEWWTFDNCSRACQIYLNFLCCYA